MFEDQKEPNSQDPTDCLSHRHFRINCVSLSWVSFNLTLDHTRNSWTILWNYWLTILKSHFSTNSGQKNNWLTIWGLIRTTLEEFCHYVTFSSHPIVNQGASRSIFQVFAISSLLTLKQTWLHKNLKHWKTH